MSATQFTSRFLIYPQDISKFIQYCERTLCIQNTVITFTLDKKTDPDDTDIFTYNSMFVADVTLYSELDSLKFVNVFSLLFTNSKYCSRI